MIQMARSRDTKTASNQLWLLVSRCFCWDTDSLLGFTLVAVVLWLWLLACGLWLVDFERRNSAWESAPYRYPVLKERPWLFDFLYSEFWHKDLPENFNAFPWGEHITNQHQQNSHLTSPLPHFTVSTKSSSLLPQQSSADRAESGNNASNSFLAAAEHTTSILPNCWQLHQNKINNE